MRTLFVFLLSSLFSLLFAQETTVKIAYPEGAGLELLAYEPIEGNYFFGSMQKVVLDDKGEIEFTFDLPHPSFFYAYLQNSPKTKIQLYVEPGITYTLQLTSGSDADPMKVSSHAIENAFLNSRTRFFSYQLRNSEYLKNAPTETTPDDLYQKIMEDKTAEFNELAALEGVSQDFIQLAITEIDYYYAGVIANIWSHKTFLEKVGETEQAAWLNFTKQQFEQYELTNTAAMPSMWYNEFGDTYTRLLGYLDPSLIDKYRALGSPYLAEWQVIKDFFDGEPEEYLLAEFLFRQSLKTNLSEDLLSLYESFKSDYPNSETLSSFQQFYDAAISFQQDDTIEKNPDVHIVDSTYTLQSFAAMVQPYRGKVIFIDMWATWCGPCVEQFKHKDKLTAFAKENDIQLVYISVDKKEDRKQLWQDMAQFHQLEGDHVLASETLRDELQELFGKNGAMYLPTYIIVDKNGKIVEKDAKDPSSGDELLEQLRRYL